MKTFKQFFSEQTKQKLDNWNSVVSSSDELQAALDILKTITTHGAEALIVGGAVRDIILGKTPHDVDIATNMDLEQVADIFKSFDIGKSKDFGIVAVPHKGYTFEIAHYREEFGSSDARHPDQVRDVGTFERDSARRDITINSLGLDHTGTIIDYQGGLEDLKNGLIRAVGDPGDRIKEDTLRIIRAIRFAAKFGFDIEPDTKQAVQELGHMLFRDEQDPDKTGVSAERLHDELFKMAESGGPALASFLEKMDEVGLLEQFLPEVKAMQGVEHNPEHHPEGDVYQHVLAALRASTTTNKPVTTLAVLFHDIGKPGTHDPADGKHTFHRHGKHGVEVFRDIANRLKFSNDEKNAIAWVIENHMKPYLSHEMKPNKLIALKNNKFWPELKDVLYADIHARGDDTRFTQEYDKIMKDFETRTAGMGDAAETKAKLSSLVNGKMVMDITGAQGPEVGRILKHVHEWILDTKPTPTKQQVIDYINTMALQFDENFKDGKKKGKSRPGRVKRAGASCSGSVTSLRKKAKAGGEKGKMYHWCANMKSGRKKK
mgnify:CR=1 FL=1